MYAVVSLLDDHHALQMQSLWRELEAECGLTGVTITPLPHISLQLALEYNLKALEPALDGLTARWKPFTVRTTGLGIFTGPSPVIFIPVVKDDLLAQFHQSVYDAIDPLAVGPSEHYTPASWVPHITLAYGDVLPGKLGCAMERLAALDFNWEIHIDHLAIVFQISGQIGRMQERYALCGPKT